MANIHAFPVVFILFFSSVASLFAQPTTSSLDDEIETIRQLPMSSLLWKLERQNGSYHKWLNNDILRHEVIKKLDSIFEYDYKKWLDFDSFMEYVHEIDTTTYQQEIEEFKKMAGDSMYQSIDAPLIDSTDRQKQFKKLWKVNKDSLFFNEWDIVFSYLQLDRNIYEPAIIEANISCLGNHTTLQYLSSVYQDLIGKMKYDTISNSIKIRNFQLIRERLAAVEAASFLHYKSDETDPKAIKEVDFYMDNDVFLLGDYNQDRNYTGGGALTISTDYFSSQWFNPEWIFKSKSMLKKPRRIMMSYQSISLGMRFYTPYIRYRDNFDLADTLFQYDRPFGSYVYLDRSKYRLCPRGLIRQTSSFQVGVIGTNAGKNIQALIHRDAVVESQKVYGWQNQIANGGRWLLQFQQTVDILLYSGTNRYKSIFSDGKNKSGKNLGLNIIGTGDIMVGGFLTAFGGGIKLSSADFTKQSGQKSIKPFKNNIYNFGIYLDAGVSYRYVVHNSMLEGFGYWTTFTDDIYDDEHESVYTLNEEFYEMENDSILNDRKRYRRTPAKYDQVERHLFLFDFGVNLRWRRMVIYGHLTYHRKEYKDPDVDYHEFLLIKNETGDDLIIDKIFYEDEVIPKLEKYRDKNFYGFGTVGVTWLL